MRRRGARPDDPGGPFDAGLQVERTWLAWGRTALAFVAVGALLMHAGRTGPGPLGIGPGLAVVASGVVTYVAGRGRHLRLRAAVRAGAGVASPSWLRLVSVFATVSAALAVAAAVTALPARPSNPRKPR